MTKQKGKSEAEELDMLVKGCERSYVEWETLYRHGCSDPFWEDGVNLDLVRNHIIYFKKEMEKLCGRLGREPPEVFLRDLPPEVPMDYMACAEEIRTQAKQMLLRLKEYNDYKELCASRYTLSPQQRAASHIDAALAIVPRAVIAADSLLELRRYIRQKSAFESITKKLEEVNALPAEEFQLSLFDIA